MLFLDTSALLKRYVDEAGTPFVQDLMDRDTDWVASALARPETEVTLCHLGLEDAVHGSVVDRLRTDWERVLVVPLDSVCLMEAAEIGCAQRVRTLDAIHLAAARRLPGLPVFLTFDRRQADAARAIGLRIAVDR